MRYSDGSSYNVTGNSSLTPAVKWLMIANGIGFGLQIVFYLLNWRLEPYLALSPVRVINSLWLWQLLTCAFLHSLQDIFHILFNMLALYFFGCMVERHYGTRKFLAFYLTCAVFASLVYTACQLITATYMLALGASGAIMGVLMVAACHYPNDIVYYLLFPIRLRTLAWIFIGINLYMAIMAPDNQVGATAHLGGLLFGYLYYRYGDRAHRYIDRIGERAVAQYERHDYKRTMQLREEVDRLLDKISREGLNSLSQQERQFLHKASKEYQKDI